MTHSELMELEVIRIEDIQSATRLSYDQSAQIMRSIRACSDLLGYRGMCCHQDYVNYMAKKVKSIT